MIVSQIGVVVPALAEAMDQKSAAEAKAKAARHEAELEELRRRLDDQE